MGLFGSIAGGVLGLGASIFGGISAAKAAKRAKENIEQEQKDYENWYDRRYNEDATQRADAQRVLTLTQESIRNRNRQAAGAQAVMGGTDESVAAAKERNNAALAEAASQIAAAGDKRKDAAEQEYMRQKSSLNKQLRDIELGKANAISTASSAAATAAGGMGANIDDYLQTR